MAGPEPGLEGALAGAGVRAPPRARRLVRAAADRRAALLTSVDIIGRRETPLSARAALLHGLATPAYGLELVERVRRHTQGFVHLRAGSVYPALRALQRQGLVQASQGPGPLAAGRPRRYFELTPKGQAARRAQQEALAAFFAAEPEDPPPVDLRLMEERVRRCAQLSAFALKLRRLGLAAARVRPD
ncbi:MAG TPA: PadR family transcriptional regulator [Vicinamibacteria bacterium]